MAEFVRRASGLLVPPDPRLHRAAHCDFLGSPMLMGGGELRDYDTGRLFELDAGNGSESGTWKLNLVTSPDDGSAQSDWDFNQPSAAMTYNSAGDQSYWAQGSNTGLQKRNANGAYQNWHKAGAAFTIDLVLSSPTLPASGCAIMTDSNPGSGADTGYLVSGDSRNRNTGILNAGSTVYSSPAQLTDANSLNNKAHLLISMQANGASFAMLNGGIAWQDASTPYSSPATTSAGWAHCIFMANYSGGYLSFMPSGARLYVVRAYNHALSQGQAQQRYQWLSQRFDFGAAP